MKWSELGWWRWRSQENLLAEALLAWRRPASGRPFVLGHRGARHGAPENTMEAFELSRREGADGVEFDVRLNGSGEVIVLHDPTLSRVTNGAERRHAESISSAEMRLLDVGAGAHIPLLSDVLEWAKKHDQRLNIELKSDVRSSARLLRGVERVVRECSALPCLIFSSFHPYFVWWLARRLPDLPRAWLVHERQRVLRYAPGLRRLGANALHPEHTLVTAERMARLKGLQQLVNVWTVNDPARARVLAELGVDSIISDVPGQILAALSGSAASR